MDRVAEEIERLERKLDALGNLRDLIDDVIRDMGPAIDYLRDNRAGQQDLPIDHKTDDAPARE